MPRALPAADASPSSPATDTESMPESDLEKAAQRVRQLEQEAMDMHDLAQRLNKEGRFQEAQAAYASMHRLEDEASALAARVGCVACVLGDAGQQGDPSGQPSLCSTDPAVFLPYQRLHPAAPWPTRAAAPTPYGPANPPPPPPPAPAAPAPPSSSSSSATPSSSVRSSRSRHLGGRCVGCVVGSLLADAAAMGVHWVYELGALAELEAERRQAALQAAGPSPSAAAPSAAAAAAGSRGPIELEAKIQIEPRHPHDYGLEFMEPPRSPFYAYAPGRNSPYGEQTLVLLRSLAESGGLHAERYADAFAAAFGPAFDGYRDVSTKGFLRNYGRAMPPPLSGATDAQANCIARLAPLVAAFAAGMPPAAGPASADRPGSAATGPTGAGGGGRGGGGGGGGGGEDGPAEQAARSGDGGGAEVEAAAAEEEEAGGLLRCVELATRVTQNTDAAVAWACVGAAVLEAILMGSSAEAAVRGVIADLESPQGRLAPFCRGPAAPELASQLSRALALASRPVAEAVAELGRNCHMPNALTSPLVVVLHVEERLARRRGNGGAATDGTDGTDGGGGGAALPAEAYVWGVRLAVREGGCCASRAAYVGACLGAMAAAAAAGREAGDAADAAAAAGGMAAPDVPLPADWLARYPLSGQVREWAQALVAARDRASE